MSQLTRDWAEEIPKTRQVKQYKPRKPPTKLSETMRGDVVCILLDIGYRWALVCTELTDGDRLIRIYEPWNPFKFGWFLKKNHRSAKGNFPIRGLRLVMK